MIDFIVLNDLFTYFLYFSFSLSWSRFESQDEDRDVVDVGKLLLLYSQICRCVEPFCPSIAQHMLCNLSTALISVGRIEQELGYLFV